MNVMYKILWRILYLCWIGTKLRVKGRIGCQCQRTKQIHSFRADTAIKSAHSNINPAGGHRTAGFLVDIMYHYVKLRYPYTADAIMPIEGNCGQFWAVYKGKVESIRGVVSPVATATTR